MKRIWFNQQKSYGYIPLRWGLGYIIQDSNDPENKFCPKAYTTRLHPLKGEYYVVEGSRLKARPVEPMIEFRVIVNCQIDLRNALATSDGKTWCTPLILARNGYSFAELDLGVHGSTFDQLRDEVLRLNPKATLDTPFYVNKLERIKNEV